MVLEQLTVFVENKKGALVKITDILSREKINLRALSIADTAEYGILRIIVSDNKRAIAALKNAGYIIKTVDVLCVKIADEPGKLSEALSILDEADINMEYLYAFMAHTDKYAYVVMRVADNESAAKALQKAGFDTIGWDEMLKL